MSEEEIIKEISIIKETLIDVLEYDLNTYKEDIYNLDTKQVSAIFGLLDLLVQEKEYNKQLVEENKYWKAKTENSISKDKIRNKIKELEEETKETFDKYGDMVENKTISVLKSLLEGE